MHALSGVRIEEWRPELPGAASPDADLDALGVVLHAVVHTGAGVSFVVPFPLEEARAFWVEKVLPGVRARTRRVLVARRDARIVGTVQMDLAVPPNQQHRAEVAKLLVLPEERRQGIARALMVALETVALSERCSRSTRGPAATPSGSTGRSATSRQASSRGSREGL